MILAYDIIFYGLVQGVGFRNTACELAQIFPHISGWVLNEFNGTVAMRLQGPDDELAHYLHLLTKESRVARLITRIVKSPSYIDSEMSLFRIER